MNKKLRVLILFITLFTMMVTVPFMASGISVTYTYDFEDGVSGMDYTSAQFYTEENGGALEISTNYARSGTKSLRQAGKTQFMNFSYATNYLTAWNTWWYEVAGASEWLRMGFYNRTIAEDGYLTAHDYTKFSDPDMFIISVYKYIDEKFYYYSSYNHEVLIGTGSDAHWENWTWSIDNNLGDMTYTYKTSSVTGTALNSTAIYEGYRIDGVMFVLEGGGVSNYYFDDLQLTFSSGYEGSGIYGCLDTTGLTQIGRFGGCDLDVRTPTLKKTYYVPVTTTIYGIELQVNYQQYVGDSTLSHYTCSVNGINLGSATCFQDEYYYAVLQWETNITVTNSLVTFEFTHNEWINNRRWIVGTGCTGNIDLDADGDVSFHHSSYESHYEFQWVGLLWVYIPVYSEYDTIVNKDLSMRWWCDGFPATETYDYEDTLGLNKYTYKNDTGYVYNLTEGYTSVVGQYTMSDASSTYTLNLELDGSESHLFNFPIQCRYPGSGFGFSPLIAGKYHITLETTSEIANVTAWVIGELPDYYISSNPLITDMYQPYSVIYSYNNAQGHPGAIGMDTDKELINSYLYMLYQKDHIITNTTNSFGYTSDSNSAEYWTLFVYANSLYTPVAHSTHIIRIPSIYDNDIKVTPDNLKITGKNEAQKSVTLSGSHMFPGGAVDIYVNGIRFRSVGDNQNFNEGYIPTKLGTFFVTLVLHQNASDVILDNCTFTVTTDDIDTGGEDETGITTLIDLIPPFMIPIIAIAIIVIFMMLPTALIFTWKTTSNANVEFKLPGNALELMTMICAVIGFIFDILIGILDWWTIGAFVFILALIIIIMWLKGSSASGGE
jgi:hypothetical protein